MFYKYAQKKKNVKKKQKKASRVNISRNSTPNLTK